MIPIKVPFYMIILLKIWRMRFIPIELRKLKLKEPTTKLIINGQIY